MTKPAHPAPAARTLGLCAVAALAASAIPIAARAQAPAESAEPPAASPANPADPWEQSNRRFYRSGRSLDRVFLEPVVVGYNHVVPHPLRSGIHNGLSNLNEPLVFVNDILQVRPKQAARTFTRFIVNSTIGIAGLFDVARRTGLPHRDNDFGVTLGRYGVKPGPYLFLPLIGPSTVRDAIGSGVDFAANPLNYIRYPHSREIRVGLAVTDFIDIRANAQDDLKALDSNSTDSYATIRSYYLQSREALIRGKTLDIQNLPDFDDPAAGTPSGTPEATPPAATPPEAAPPAPEPAAAETPKDAPASTPQP